MKTIAEDLAYEACLRELGKLSVLSRMRVMRRLQKALRELAKAAPRSDPRQKDLFSNDGSGDPDVSDS